MDIEAYLSKAKLQMDKAQCFFGHGYASAHDECVQMIAFVLGQTTLTQHELSQPLSSDSLAKLDEILKRRTQEKIPLAYLMRQAYFADLTLYVDERVHIPRSPIAELIESQFSPWVSLSPHSKILDMCTGSGAIALACAYHLGIEVTGVDISRDALAVAKQNQENLKLKDLHWLLSNLYEKVSGQFDVIVANPPYVSDQSYNALPQEFHHEPRTSFVSENSGLQVTIDLLKQSASHLTDDGILIVEVGESESLMESQFPSLPYTWLDFERGGSGVFLLHKKDLRDI